LPGSRQTVEVLPDVHHATTLVSALHRKLDDSVLHGKSLRKYRNEPDFQRIKNALDLSETGAQLGTGFLV
jgi:hypothetical protein